MPAPPFPRTATYRPVVIWGTGTGVDTSEYDDVSRYYLNNPGLQIDGIGRDQARAYAPPAAAAFDFTLTNWDGRFSPGGPIGSFVGRGPKTYLEVMWGNDVGANADDIGTDDPRVLANGVEFFRLFDGTINTAQHTLTRPQRSVQIRALGHFSTLLDRRPQTTQLYENIRTDQAISVLLDLVGWPADMRSLDTGDTLLTYWWLNGSTDGLTALNQILGAEGAGGCAYEQGGVFYFEGRQYRQNANRSMTAQWFFSSGGFATDPGANSELVEANDQRVLANGTVSTGLLLDINPSEYTSNPDEVISAATAAINVRTPTTLQRIWEYGGPLNLGPGQELVMEATLSDPYKDAVPLLLDGDYTVPPGAGALASPPELLATSGSQVRIKWVAGPGGATVYGVTSDGPQLRAVNLPIASQVTVRSTIDSSMQALRYSPREHRMDAWPEVSFNYMLDVVNSMARRYQNERRQAVIRIANLDGDHMLAMLRMRVSDRIQWVQRHGGLNDPYWIEQISHEVAPGGHLHIVTLGCERVFALVGGKFDDAQFDLDQFGD